MLVSTLVTLCPVLNLPISATVIWASATEVLLLLSRIATCNAQVTAQNSAAVLIVSTYVKPLSGSPCSILKPYYRFITSLELFPTDPWHRLLAAAVVAEAEHQYSQ